MTLSDATVTKWELPDLFSGKSSASRPKTQAASASNSEHEEGRQAGFEQGKQEGLKAAQKEVNDKLSALESVFFNLSAPLAQVDNQIARDLIQLSIRLAETIIHREVDLQPELVEKQVAEALATLTTKSAEIEIKLHPQDARILEKARESSSGVETDQPAYKIIHDPNLHRGGCVLQTPTTLVDATIEKQLQDLLSEMLDTAAQNQQEV